MTTTKPKPARAAKRNLFAELSEGMAALTEQRDGKRTLRTHAVEYKPAPKVTPRELVRVRECVPTRIRDRGCAIRFFTFGDLRTTCPSSV